MTSGRPRPRWLFLVSPRWLAWHAFAVVAAWGMLWLGDWQYHRAEGGNALSWAYTFEWPIFTIFGVVFWAKTIIDEWHRRAALAAAAQQGGQAPRPAMSIAPELPLGAHTAVLADEEADDDPELAAYNAYLARLNTRSAAR
jgi:hypothetical protein